MLHIYCGPHAALSEAHQNAIAELTARRYLEDFLPPSAHALLVMRGEPNPSWLQFEAVREQMLHFADGVHTCAMFAEAGGRVVAIATHRLTPGIGTQLPLTLCDGKATSTLPTNRNFLGLSYPRLPCFDPDDLGEGDIADLGRICKLTRLEIAGLVAQGFIDEAEAQYAHLCALPEVTSGFFDAITQSQKAFIMAMRPKVARSMATLGYRLIPLYTEGVTPQLHGLPEKSLLGLYFSCYSRELNALHPGIVERLGVAGAIAALYRAHPRFCELPLVLPLLVMNDAALDEAARAIRKGCAMVSAKLCLEGNLIRSGTVVCA